VKTRETAVKEVCKASVRLKVDGGCIRSGV
jgi:hypothetical protein